MIQYLIYILVNFYAYGTEIDTTDETFKYSYLSVLCSKTRSCCSFNYILNSRKYDQMENNFVNNRKEHYINDNSKVTVKLNSFLTCFNKT